MSEERKITSIAPLNYKYVIIEENDVPPNLKPFLVSFRNKEIEEYEVLFFHGLLTKIFGPALIIDHHIIEPEETDQRTWALPVE